MRSKLFLKLFALICVFLMVMGAYLVAYSSVGAPFTEEYGIAEDLDDMFAQCGRLGGIFSAAAAIVFSWLGCKLEKPGRFLAIGVGVGCAAVLGITGVAALSLRNLSQAALRQAAYGMIAAALLRFALILAMLLAIIWLVGNMIRRCLTERK